MTWLIALGGFGGISILLSTVVIIGRGIFKQVTATEENTTALKGLSDKIGHIEAVYQNHETRITVLEDRVKR